MISTLGAGDKPAPLFRLDVTASTKMIPFDYSNKDIKNEEGELRRENKIASLYASR